uniref:Uncharacterized protein n=1 Tax=Meloidogyne incognita TaxID=6306 RepID=A0A914N4D2_MELIC
MNYSGDGVHWRRLLRNTTLTPLDTIRSQNVFINNRENAAAYPKLLLQNQPAPLNQQ